MYIMITFSVLSRYVTCLDPVGNRFPSKDYFPTSDWSEFGDLLQLYHTLLPSEGTWHKQSLNLQFSVDKKLN